MSILKQGGVSISPFFFGDQEDIRIIKINGSIVADGLNSCRAKFAMSLCAAWIRHGEITDALLWAMNTINHPSSSGSLWSVGSYPNCHRSKAE